MQRTMQLSTRALFLGGCALSRCESEAGKPLRLDSRDPGFRLSPAERAALLPDTDPDAVQHLLSMIRPEKRADVLRHFRPHQPGEDWGWLFRFDDPQLQSVLEEVWAPVWEQAPPAILAEGGYPHPGRELVLRRRAAAVRG